MVNVLLLYRFFSCIGAQLCGGYCWIFFFVTYCSIQDGMQDFRFNFEYLFYLNEKCVCSKFPFLLFKDVMFYSEEILQNKIHL